MRVLTDRVRVLAELQIGEFATDYIEVRRDYTDWTPPYRQKGEIDSDHGPVAAGDRHGAPDIQLSHLNGAAKGANGNGSAVSALPPITEKPEADVNGNAHANGAGNGVP